ncbi:MULTISPECIES: DUF916 domain-containing protein [Catenuloplanes]|uniref:DUF916 domain-containing protein n=1 Tax=Catenuloplanes niger TaxID=587534 RepID=A0AAE3ZHY3_9ACTN|nr:DUF916 domain-containing protein [Catenuloplanes niger]MDR7320287.1 hypothetical protein [Catenuloplanes niger]
MATHAVLVLLLLLPAVPADAPLTWGVAPSSAAGPDGRAAFAHRLDPGTVLRDHVAISNPAPEPLRLTVYAADADVGVARGFDLLPAGVPSTGAGTWVRLDRTDVTVPGGGRVVVPFTVTVPADATPGDHAAGIVAAWRAPGPAGGAAGVAVERRVGSRIHLRVAGALRPRLTASLVSVAHPGGWNPFGRPDVTVEAVVRNEGNVRLRAAAAVTVTGPFPRVPGGRAHEPVPELLPGQSHRFTVRVATFSRVRIQARVDVTPAPPVVVGDEGAVVVAPAAATGAAWSLSPGQGLASAALIAAVAAGWARRRRASGTAGPRSGDAGAPNPGHRAQT